MLGFATPRTAVERAADAIHSAAIHLLRSLRRVDAKLDMGPAGLSALSILVFAGPKTMGQLAKLEQVRNATMTRIVRRLERGGMVEAQRAHDDKRSTIVSATSLGRITMMRARGGRIAELERRMNALSDQDVALLARAAQVIERISKGDTLS